MKKIMTMMIGLLLLSSLIGCSTTTKLVYVEPKAFEFQKTVQPKPRAIRVHKKDKALYELYIEKFRNQIKFHNEQIDDYFKSISKEKDE